MAESVRKNGILEPLRITIDGYILSGHRRYAAARLAGLRIVPCFYESISRHEDPARFLVLLREYNRQRLKTFDEQFREEVISTNPDDAYRSLVEHREQSSEVISSGFDIREIKNRCEISSAKSDFLKAIIRVLNARRKFWPLSDRQIHYALLNDPPLKHFSKPDSRYANDKQSYQNLVNLLTRARLDGSIPMKAIADETRPVVNWDTFSGPQPFIRKELDEFLKGYWRDLMQSQPNHFEIIEEKNTILSVVHPVAMRYCVPYTVGRGYCSLPPRHALVERYRQSGKDKLILLILSDFDPDGEEIAHSFARSLRDDFDVDNILPIKVGLTAEQIKEYKLPPMMKAKEGSANFKKFTDKHGDDVFELEALPPETLQSILIQAIDDVIDVEKFNAEIDAEKADAAHLDTIRQKMKIVMQNIVGGPVDA